jgi:hypothetical protein
MPPVPPRPTPTNSDAILSLVLAVVTMSTSCFPLGFVAMWFGSRAKKKAKEENDTGSNVTLATVGQIMGGIFGALWLLFWLFEAVMIFLGVGLAIFAGP